LLVDSVLFLQVISIATPTTNEAKFQDFIARFRKFYTATQYAERFQVFKTNLRIAEELDARDEKSSFGVTKFMDLSQDEFRAQFLLKNFTKGHNRENAVQFVPSTKVQAYPAAYDWGSKGVITAVYNQEQCGSCWAFSTTENIESMWAIAGHGLDNLSMQQIVDCDKFDSGCNGGNPPTAYQYVMDAGGLEAYADYPYIGIGGPCRFNAADIEAKISNWQWITQDDDEAAMQSFTYTTGPPSICVDATIWQYYTGGVVTTASGCGTALDHCVQITGWQQMSGMSVWNVRNSWGADWGPNQGYIYIEMGHDVCGIGQEVTSSII